MKLKIEKKKKREINETKNQFSENINEMDKLLARPAKLNKEETQITNIRNETGHIATDPKDFKRKIRITTNNSIHTISELGQHG